MQPQKPKEIRYVLIVVGTSIAIAIFAFWYSGML